MKGILFAGDSFTWGEGLHYYSELPNINWKEHGHDAKNYTPAHRNFIEANRFARKVANYFKTFDLVRFSNGGNNDEIFEFIDNIETEYQIRYIIADQSKHRMFTYKLKDFDYIVIQLTDIFRADVNLPNGNTCNIRSEESIRSSGFDNYLNENYNGNINLFIHNYLVSYIDIIESNIKKYEKNGIKRCFLTSWHNDIICYITEIKKLLESGIICRIIAEKYNVSRLTISDIKLKKTWINI
jgi:hypothetical protein